MEPSNSKQLSVDVEAKNDVFYCSLCNVKNNNVGNYNSHITSKKHLKKIKLAEEAANVAKLPIQENTISNFDVGEDDMDDTKFCKVCLKHLPGQESALAHYRSKKHKHKLSIFEKTWNPECVACKKSFSCEQQWKQHVESAKHIKVMSCEQTDMDFSFDFDFDGGELETTIAEKVLEDLACELCAKRFSGTKPIQDHFKSKEHLKNLKIAKRLKSDLAELEKRKHGVETTIFHSDDEDETETPRKKCKLATD